MKKTAFIILGILLALFGVGQLLQLMGLIGTKTFSLSGVAFVILGFVLSVACFKKAREK